MAFAVHLPKRRVKNILGLARSSTNTASAPSTSDETQSLGCVKFPVDVYDGLADVRSASAILLSLSMADIIQ